MKNYTAGIVLGSLLVMAPPAMASEFDYASQDAMMMEMGQLGEGEMRQADETMDEAEIMADTQEERLGDHGEDLENMVDDLTNGTLDMADEMMEKTDEMADDLAEEVFDMAIELEEKPKESVPARYSEKAPVAPSFLDNFFSSVLNLFGLGN